MEVLLWRLGIDFEIRGHSVWKPVRALEKKRKKK